jgi:thiamine phosphate synthase YjbQ (UPF0047 family)
MAIEEIAPSNIPYEHDRRWGDGNGFSHVRAALMKPSLSVPLIKGKLSLGTWQQIVFIDFVYLVLVWESNVPEIDPKNAWHMLHHCLP